MSSLICSAQRSHSAVGAGGCTVYREAGLAGKSATHVAGHNREQGELQKSLVLGGTSLLVCIPYILDGT